MMRLAWLLRIEVVRNNEADVALTTSPNNPWLAPSSRISENASNSSDLMTETISKTNHFGFPQGDCRKTSCNMGASIGILFGFGIIHRGHWPIQRPAYPE